jgi:hypothetical protein
MEDYRAVRWGSHILPCIGLTGGSEVISLICRLSITSRNTPVSYLLHLRLYIEYWPTFTSADWHDMYLLQAEKNNCLQQKNPSKPYLPRWHFIQQVFVSILMILCFQPCRQYYSQSIHDSERCLTAGVAMNLSLVTENWDKNIPFSDTLCSQWGAEMNIGEASCTRTCT